MSGIVRFATTTTTLLLLGPVLVISCEQASAPSAPPAPPALAAARRPPPPAAPTCATAVAHMTAVLVADVQGETTEPEPKMIAEHYVRRAQPVFERRCVAEHWSPALLACLAAACSRSPLSPYSDPEFDLSEALLGGLVGSAARPARRSPHHLLDACEIPPAPPA